MINIIVSIQSSSWIICDHKLNKIALYTYMYVVSFPTLIIALRDKKHIALIAFILPTLFDYSAK